MPPCSLACYQGHNPVTRNDWDTLMAEVEARMQKWHDKVMAKMGVTEMAVAAPPDPATEPTPDQPA